jgi:hypothetical protein
LPQLSHAQFPSCRHPVLSSFIDGGKTAVVGDMRGADGEGLENARTMGLLPEGPDALRQLRQFPIHNSERVEVFYSVI